MLEFSFSGADRNVFPIFLICCRIFEWTVTLINRGRLEFQVSSSQPVLFFLKKSECYVATKLSVSFSLRSVICLLRFTWYGSKMNNERSWSAGCSLKLLIASIDPERWMSLKNWEKLESLGETFMHVDIISILKGSKVRSAHVLTLYRSTRKTAEVSHGTSTPRFRSKFCNMFLDKSNASSFTS